jgi:transcriptional regulator with XRE-family HTH domain
MHSNEAAILRGARLVLGLTTAEAGRLVGVTRRAWEHWEGGSRRIPIAAYELFLAKAEGLVPSNLENENERRLYVIFSPDGQRHIDVISNRNFLSWELGKKPNHVLVHSLAYDLLDRKRHRRSVEASIEANPRLLVALKQWEANLTDGS